MSAVGYQPVLDGGPLAVISDVHGNVKALEAVLRDISSRGIESVVNLGDCVYGSLEAGATADLLMETGVLSISGNQDRVLFDRSDEVLRSPDHRLVVGQLGEEHLRWLENLPAVHATEEVFFCHGTPDSDETYLLERVVQGGASLAEDGEISARLNGIGQEVVFCGHSHVPRTVRLADGRLVVNPGSVGLPAYTNDLPLPHAMESGNPYAKYVVYSRRAGGPFVEHVLVPYPWGEAAAVARRNGREDRARWIETGRASPPRSRQADR